MGGGTVARVAEAHRSLDVVSIPDTPIRGLPGLTTTFPRAGAVTEIGSC
jgi:hypothetical protein